MAIRHGLAGQYPKSQASDRAQRIILASITCAGFGCGAIGWVLGYFWGIHAVYTAIIAVLFVGGAVLLIWQKIDPILGQIAKERIKYLRGGQGEALIAWLLQDLDDRWHIFNGIKLQADSDIDHILVGPGGLFCISTKSQRGRFEGTADGLLHNGQPCDFAKQVLWQTMNLKDRLVGLMGNKVPWLHPVLAVPLGFTEDDACGGSVWLVHHENIVERLGAGNKLSKQEIDRTVKALEMLQARAADVYQPTTKADPAA